MPTWSCSRSQSRQRTQKKQDQAIVKRGLPSPATRAAPGVGSGHRGPAAWGPHRCLGLRPSVAGCLRAAGQRTVKQARRPSLAAHFLLLCIRLYQATLRPYMGMHCRFHPTCSTFGTQAIQRFGACRGGMLTVSRLLRCHPLGGAGYDPVPDATTDTRKDA